MEWLDLCAQVCEACMGYGEKCACGRHVSALPVGEYICPVRQECVNAPGCMHAVYHEPDDGCDWKEYTCFGVAVNCFKDGKCPKCGKDDVHAGYCYACQEWV